MVTARNKHFSLSHVKWGQRSLIKSVKVVMVLSVSLHHQRCYNFCKIQQEIAKWTGAVVSLCLFSVSFLPGGPCKCVYYTSECQRAVSTVDLTDSENHQRHLS